MNFEGKTILVVGGGAGIGAAIGVEAARRGAAVAIADLSTKALQEVSDRIAEVGGKVHTTEVDIGDDASVAAMARWSVETIGAPDILLVTVIDYMSSSPGSMT
jgi:NAD(P)-dependent dehydrogenase (short-subunit alcohol dehydrogenase family)